MAPLEKEVFGCLSCPGVIFDSKMELLLHRADKHFLIISCKDCKLVFTDRSKAREHVLRDHINEEEERTKENEAKRQRLETIALPDKLPEGIITGEGMHQCPMCFEEFHLALFLKQHIIVIHFNWNPGQCHVDAENCHQTMTKFGNMNGHIIRIHMPELLDSLQEGLTNCVYCPRKFKTSSGVASHCVIHHIGELKKEHDKNQVNRTVDGMHYCNECSEDFLFKLWLDQHEATKHDNKPENQCHLCLKKLQNASEVQWHLIAEHMKEILKSIGQRLVCGECFVYSTNMLHHYSIKHLETVWLYSKQNKTINFNNSLAAASKTITKQNIAQNIADNKANIKMHQCTKCPQQFYIGVHLNQHLANHFHRDLLLCHVCKNRFSSIQSLELHLVNKHMAQVVKRLKTTKSCMVCYKDSTGIIAHYIQHHPEKIRDLEWNYMWKCNKDQPETSNNAIEKIEKTEINEDNTEDIEAIKIEEIEIMDVANEIKVDPLVD